MSQRYVTIPPRKLVRREKGVEIEIRVALAAEGILTMKHHVDNRGQKPCVNCGHVEKADRGARTGLGLGVSDLICVVPPLGRFAGIEVKREHGGVLSEAQERWGAVVQRYGGAWGEARSVDDALRIVRGMR